MQIGTVQTFDRNTEITGLGPSILYRIQVFAENMYTVRGRPKPDFASCTTLMSSK